MSWLPSKYICKKVNFNSANFSASVGSKKSDSLKSDSFPSEFFFYIPQKGVADFRHTRLNMNKVSFLFLSASAWDY